jgi:hypothetical protein
MGEVRELQKGEGKTNCLGGGGASCVVVWRLRKRTWFQGVWAPFLVKDNGRL